MSLILVFTKHYAGMEVKESSPDTPLGFLFPLKAGMAVPRHTDS
jgi:hypothetical protein